MAEIRVERKPQRKLWPLLLGLLVAALLVWGLVAMNNDRDESNVAQPQQSRLIPMNDLNDLAAAPAIDLARAA